MKMQFPHSLFIAQSPVGLGTFITVHRFAGLYMPLLGTRDAMNLCSVSRLSDTIWKLAVAEIKENHEE